MTLLSMSLNAQTKVETPPDGYFRMGPSRVSTTPVTPPYSNSFDSSTDFAWWETINNNGDSYTWELYNNSARIHWNSSQAADDWLVTAPITLKAGKTYKFYIDTWAELGSTYPEQLEVKLASANTNAALSAGTTIIGQTTVTASSSSPQNLSNTNVTVSADGNYYIGIHGISDANMYYLYVDNFVIDVDITDPTITASPTSVSMNAAPGGTTTQTVTVTGLNLTDGITYTLTDANGVFSVSPASLGTTGGTLTITYSPTAPGNHTATLVLNSTGADPVTINITGESVAGTVYELVTDPSTQLVAGKEYILVAKNNQYAMGALSSTSGYGTAIAITDNGDGTVTVPGTASPMVLTLHNYSSNYTSGYTFTLTNGSYLKPYASNSTNLTTATTTSDNNCWTTVADVKPTGGYGLKNYLTTSRALAFQESSSVTARFAYYGTNNLTANSTTYYYALLYKKVDNTPELTAPTNGDEVNVGVNYGSAPYAYTDITVSGRNLTDGLTVSVTGTGFSVTPTTLTAAAVNAGTTVRVTYNGTDPNATGTLTITSDNNEVSAVTVDLTATVPVLTAPTTGTTVNVGTNEGGGVSTTVTVSGSDLTENLTVSVSGTGFTVSPTSISAADANAGTTVTVTYDGTDPNATGTLTIGSSQVSVTVDLTASYVYHAPELTAPTNNSTVNVGTNTGSGVSKTINIKGNYLTQDLNVTVSGTGFSVSRDITVTAAEANSANGQDIIVTYNGTDENATGELTISSSEVSATVHLTASYADNGEITVANGTTANMYLPVYGSYYEEVQMNQMIYPASMLEDMEGKYITSITFYPASGTTSGGSAVSGIMFSGGKVMLSLGSTTNNSFTSNSAISATVTEVASITDVQQDANLTAWTFTFDTPYLYEGGNLLLQVDTEVGNYYRTFFYGTTMSNMGRHQCTSETALDNFLPKATFTYSSTAPLPPAVEGGLLRLHLLFCDQLKAAIPDDNSHEDAYGYVLRWEPQGEDMKESGRVKVNIQKTDCEVLGYYTLDQIDLDKNIGSYDETTGTIKHDQGLTMDVITAQVEFDLSSSNDMLNYYYLQGKEAGYPSPDEFLSQLHRQENFTYREMWPDAPEFDEVYDSGVHHYFDDSTPIKTGAYGSNTRFMSYAPSVTTWGIQRRYFELDGKDNTYGAPVWKTSVGKVRMQGTPVAERQSNANNSVNWTDENGAAASIYVLDNIEAVGNLPHTDKTKVKFEPYMFRVFVESENGLLRNYNVVGEDPNNTTQPGEHIEGATTSDDDSRGPLCIWSGYVKYDEQTGLPTNDPENGVELTITQDPLDNTQQIYTFHKNKVAGGPSSENWKEHNAVFGALDALSIAGYNENGQPILQSGINEKDLRVFVRFYYNVEGRADGHVIMGRAADADRPGNGSESPGTAPSPWTAVKEISYNGEVVSVTYVNSLGMQSDQPFEGVNIVVTRYSDGKVSTTKVLR